MVEPSQARTLRQLGIVLTIPMLLVSGPLVGFFVSRWAAGFWGNRDWVIWLGVALGFLASALEVKRMIQQLAREDQSDRKT